VDAHTRAHTHTHIHTHTRMRTYFHSYTHTRAHAHINIQAHTTAHKRTLAHAHTGRLQVPHVWARWAARMLGWIAHSAQPGQSKQADAAEEGGGSTCSMPPSQPWIPDLLTTLFSRADAEVAAQVCNIWTHVSLVAAWRAASISSCAQQLCKLLTCPSLVESLFGMNPRLSCLPLRLSIPSHHGCPARQQGAACLVAAWLGNMGHPQGTASVLTHKDAVAFAVPPIL